MVVALLFVRGPSLGFASFDFFLISVPGRRFWSLVSPSLDLKRAMTILGNLCKKADLLSICYLVQISFIGVECEAEIQ